MKSDHCHQRELANSHRNNNNNGKLIQFSHLNILVLLLIFTVTSANHQVVKRMELETCLGKCLPESKMSIATHNRTFIFQVALTSTPTP